MNRFCYDVYVPSIQSNVKFYELLNKDYLSMLKFLQNNDDPGFATFVDHLLTQLIVDKHAQHQFDRLDKYCILLTIMMICVGNVLEFTTTCSETDKQFTIDIVIGKVVSSINDIQVSSHVVDVGDDIQIKLSPPRSLFGPFRTPINSITVAGVEQDTTSLTDDQLDDLIATLPYNVFTQLQQVYKDIHEQCDNVTYFSYKNPHQLDKPPVEYVFNLFDDSFFQFIKLLIRDNLINYYKMMYTLTTKFKLDMSYIQNITPNETKTYMSLIREDVKQLKEKQEQAQQSAKHTRAVAPDPSGG